MKYYCNHCESIFETKYTLTKCSHCYGPLVEVPDYETPEQYEKRTGEPFPEDGLVWFRHKTWKESWEHTRLCHLKTDDAEWLANNIIVIADPPVPPPDGWKPEEVSK
jgi:hypothetical protein